MTADEVKDTVRRLIDVADMLMLEVKEPINGVDKQLLEKALHQHAEMLRKHFNLTRARILKR